VKSLAKDNFWSRLFRKKGKQPNKEDISEEMDEIIDKIEELLDNKFKECSENVIDCQNKRKTPPFEKKDRRFEHLIYGYSVTFGPDGKPRIRQLGNLTPKRVQKKTKYPKKRDLLIDVIPNDKEIQVVMELPGVSEKEIKVNASQDNVTVATYDMKFNYYKRIQMPYLIDPKSLKTKYINGVLTINTNKAEKKLNKLDKFEPL